jgi:hypothetical protein
MYAHCAYALLWPIQTLPLLSLTPLPPICSFHEHLVRKSPCVLYLHILWFPMLLIICHCSLFLSLFLWVPLFLTSHSDVLRCFTSEFVHNHACFCVHVYLWICLPHMREDKNSLCFWAWLTSLNIISYDDIHLPSNHMKSFLMAD